MSLPLDFRSASGQELSLLSTPDSRGLGSRPVYTIEVPTPPVPPRDELVPVPFPPPTYRQSPVEAPARSYLPSAMTDLKLGMDWYSMPITPFCYFVAPELFSSPRLFPRFMDLPPEIHQIIFRFCDTPTLFHLMHTSSYTREECFDLFWEFREENTSYRLEDFPERFFGDVPMIYDCPEFASRINQLEITVSFDFLEGKREFWTRFRDFFPSVQSVVFYNTNLGRSSLPPGRGERPASEYYAISKLVALAPPNITALVATPYEGEESGFRSRLWRVQAPQWSLVKDPWTPMRVVLPPKRIRPGILNHFLTSARLGTGAIREMYGTDWLKWETYLRYADASGIECPHPDCTDKFPNEADWKRHLHSDIHNGNLRNYLNHSMLTYCRNTPAEVKAVLDEKQRRFDEANLIRNIVVEELIQWYREHGEHGKRRFEEALVHQLKEYEFPIYAESLNQWELWRDFISEWQDDWDGDPGYPEEYEVDSDQECPSDEDLNHLHAGEGNCDNPEGSDEKKPRRSCHNAEDLCSAYAGEEYFDYSECPDD